MRAVKCLELLAIFDEERQEGDYCDTYPFTSRPPLRAGRPFRALPHWIV